MHMILYTHVNPTPGSLRGHPALKTNILGKKRVPSSGTRRVRFVVHRAPGAFRRRGRFLVPSRILRTPERMSQAE